MGDFIAQQDTPGELRCQRHSVPGPRSRQVQYNTLIGPLAPQHQAFSQAGVPPSRPQNKLKNPLLAGFFMLMEK